MAQEDLVSVIIPCYNSREYVGEAIRSVIDQSHGNVEIIVVDDGSTDDSYAFLSRLQERHRGRVKLFSQENQGPYPARNYGVGRAEGRYIAFLDADDYWDRNFLEKMLGSLHESGNDIAYCGWQNVGPEIKESKPYVPPEIEGAGKVETLLSSASPWPIHAAVLRRSTFEEAEGFDTGLPTCMDYDLWLRIAAGHRVGRVPEVLAFYRHHGAKQITSTQWRQARNVWLIKRNFIKKNPELVRNIPGDRIRKLTHGALLQRGYTCYWKRDLISAQKIFRLVLKNRYFSSSDLKYLLPSLLPSGFYRKLVLKADASRTGN